MFVILFNKSNNIISKWIDLITWFMIRTSFRIGKIIVKNKSHSIQQTQMALAVSAMIELSASV